MEWDTSTSDFADFFIHRYALDIEPPSPLLEGRSELLLTPESSCCYSSACDRSPSSLERQPQSDSAVAGANEQLQRVGREGSEPPYLLLPFTWGCWGNSDRLAEFSGNVANGSRSSNKSGTSSSDGSSTRSPGGSSRRCGSPGGNSATAIRCASNSSSSNQQDVSGIDSSSCSSGGDTAAGASASADCAGCKKGWRSWCSCCLTVPDTTGLFLARSNGYEGSTRSLHNSNSPSSERSGSPKYAEDNSNNDDQDTATSRRNICRDSRSANSSIGVVKPQSCDSQASPETRRNASGQSACVDTTSAAGDKQAHKILKESVAEYAKELGETRCALPQGGKDRTLGCSRPETPRQQIHAPGVTPRQLRDQQQKLLQHLQQERTQHAAAQQQQALEQQAPQEHHQSQQMQQREALQQQNTQQQNTQERNTQQQNAQQPVKIRTERKGKEETEWLWEPYSCVPTPEESEATGTEDTAMSQQQPGRHESQPQQVTVSLLLNDFAAAAKELCRNTETVPSSDSPNTSSVPSSYNSSSSSNSSTGSCTVPNSRWNSACSNGSSTSCSNSPSSTNSGSCSSNSPEGDTVSGGPQPGTCTDFSPLCGESACEVQFPCTHTTAKRPKSTHVNASGDNQNGSGSSATMEISNGAPTTNLHSSGSSSSTLYTTDGPRSSSSWNSIAAVAPLTEEATQDEASCRASDGSTPASVETLLHPGSSSASFPAWHATGKQSCAQQQQPQQQQLQRPLQSLGQQPHQRECLRRPLQQAQHHQEQGGALRPQREQQDGGSPLQEQHRLEEEKTVQQHILREGPQQHRACLQQQRTCLQQQHASPQQRPPFLQQEKDPCQGLQGVHQQSYSKEGGGSCCTSEKAAAAACEEATRNASLPGGSPSVAPSQCCATFCGAAEVAESAPELVQSSKEQQQHQLLSSVQRIRQESASLFGFAAGSCFSYDLSDAAAAAYEAVATTAAAHRAGPALLERPHGTPTGRIPGTAADASQAASADAPGEPLAGPLQESVNGVLLDAGACLPVASKDVAEQDSPGTAEGTEAAAGASPPAARTQATATAPAAGEEAQEAEATEAAQAAGAAGPVREAAPVGEAADGRATEGDQAAQGEDAAVDRPLVPANDTQCNSRLKRSLPLQLPQAKEGAFFSHAVGRWDTPVGGRAAVKREVASSAAAEACFPFSSFLFNNAPVAASFLASAASGCSPGAAPENTEPYPSTETTTTTIAAASSSPVPSAFAASLSTGGATAAPTTLPTTEPAASCSSSAGSSSAVTHSSGAASAASPAGGTPPILVPASDHSTSSSVCAASETEQSQGLQERHTQQHTSPQHQQEEEEQQRAASGSASSLIFPRSSISLAHQMGSAAALGATAPAAAAAATRASSEGYNPISRPPDAEPFPLFSLKSEETARCDKILPNNCSFHQYEDASSAAATERTSQGGAGDGGSVGEQPFVGACSGSVVEVARSAPEVTALHGSNTSNGEHCNNQSSSSSDYYAIPLCSHPRDRTVNNENTGNSSSNVGAVSCSVYTHSTSSSSYSDGRVTNSNVGCISSYGDDSKTSTANSDESSGGHSQDSSWYSQERSSTSRSSSGSLCNSSDSCSGADYNTEHRASSSFRVCRLPCNTHSIGCVPPSSYARACSSTLGSTDSGSTTSSASSSSSYSSSPIADAEVFSSNSSCPSNLLSCCDTTSPAPLLSSNTAVPANGSRTYAPSSGNNPFASHSSSNSNSILSSNNPSYSDGSSRLTNSRFLSNSRSSYLSSGNTTRSSLLRVSPPRVYHVVMCTRRYWRVEWVSPDTGKRVYKHFGENKYGGGEQARRVALQFWQEVRRRSAAGLQKGEWRGLQEVTRRVREEGVDRILCETAGMGAEKEEIFSSGGAPGTTATTSTLAAAAPVGAYAGVAVNECAVNDPRGLTGGLVAAAGATAAGEAIAAAGCTTAVPAADVPAAVAVRAAAAESAALATLRQEHPRELVALQLQGGAATMRAGTSRDGELIETGVVYGEESAAATSRTGVPPAVGSDTSLLSAPTSRENSAATGGAATVRPKALLSTRACSSSSVLQEQRASCLQESVAAAAGAAAVAAGAAAVAAEAAAGAAAVAAVAAFAEQQQLLAEEGDFATSGGGAGGVPGCSWAAADLNAPASIEQAATREIGLTAGTVPHQKEQLPHGSAQCREQVLDSAQGAVQRESSTGVHVETTTRPATAPAPPSSAGATEATRDARSPNVTEGIARPVTATDADAVSSYSTEAYRCVQTGCPTGPSDAPDRNVVGHCISAKAYCGNDSSTSQPWSRRSCSDRSYTDSANDLDSSNNFSYSSTSANMPGSANESTPHEVEALAGLFSLGERDRVGGAPLLRAADEAAATAATAGGDVPERAEGATQAENAAGRESVMEPAGEAQEEERTKVPRGAPDAARFSTMSYLSCSDTSVAVTSSEDLPSCEPSVTQPHQLHSRWLERGPAGGADTFAVTACATAERNVTSAAAGAASAVATAARTTTGCPSLAREMGGAASPEAGLSLLPGCHQQGDSQQLWQDYYQHQDYRGRGHLENQPRQQQQQQVYQHQLPQQLSEEKQQPQQQLQHLQREEEEPQQVQQPRHLEHQQYVHKKVDCVQTLRKREGHHLDDVLQQPPQKKKRAQQQQKRVPGVEQEALLEGLHQRLIQRRQLHEQRKVHHSPCSALPNPTAALESGSSSDRRETVGTGNATCPQVQQPLLTDACPVLPPYPERHTPEQHFYEKQQCDIAQEQQAQLIQQDDRQGSQRQHQYHLDLPRPQQLQQQVQQEQHRPQQRQQLQGQEGALPMSPQYIRPSKENGLQNSESYSGGLWVNTSTALASWVSTSAPAAADTTATAHEAANEGAAREGTAGGNALTEGKAAAEAAGAGAAEHEEAQCTTLGDTHPSNIGAEAERAAPTAELFQSSIPLRRIDLALSGPQQEQQQKQLQHGRHGQQVKRQTGESEPLEGEGNTEQPHTSPHTAEKHSAIVFQRPQEDGGEERDRFSISEEQQRNEQQQTQGPLRQQEQLLQHQLKQQQSRQERVGTSDGRQMLQRTASGAAFTDDYMQRQRLETDAHRVPRSAPLVEVSEISKFEASPLAGSVSIAPPEDSLSAAGAGVHLRLAPPAASLLLTQAEPQQVQQQEELDQQRQQSRPLPPEGATREQPSRQRRTQQQQVKQEPQQPAYVQQELRQRQEKVQDAQQRQGEEEWEQAFQSQTQEQQLPLDSITEAREIQLQELPCYRANEGTACFPTSPTHAAIYVSNNDFMAKSKNHPNGGGNESNRNSKATSNRQDVLFPVSEPQSSLLTAGSVKPTASTPHLAALKQLQQQTQHQPPYGQSQQQAVQQQRHQEEQQQQQRMVPPTPGHCFSKPAPSITGSLRVTLRESQNTWTGTSLARGFSLPQPEDAAAEGAESCHSPQSCLLQGDRYLSSATAAAPARRIATATAERATALLAIDAEARAASPQAESLGFCSSAAYCGLTTDKQHAGAQVSAVAPERSSQLLPKEEALTWAGSAGEPAGVDSQSSTESSTSRADSSSLAATAELRASRHVKLHSTVCGGGAGAAASAWPSTYQIAGTGSEAVDDHAEEHRKKEAILSGLEADYLHRAGTSEVQEAGVIVTSAAESVEAATVSYGLAASANMVDAGGTSGQVERNSAALPTAEAAGVRPPETAERSAAAASPTSDGRHMPPTVVTTIEAAVCPAVENSQHQTLQEQEVEQELQQEGQQTVQGLYRDQRRDREPQEQPLAQLETGMLQERRDQQQQRVQQHDTQRCWRQQPGQLQQSSPEEEVANQQQRQCMVFSRNEEPQEQQQQFWQSTCVVPASIQQQHNMGCDILPALERQDYHSYTQLLPGQEAEQSRPLPRSGQTQLEEHQQQHLQQPQHRYVEGELKEYETRDCTQAETEALGSARDGNVFSTAFEAKLQQESSLAPLTDAAALSFGHGQKASTCYGPCAAEGAAVTSRWSRTAQQAGTTPADRFKQPPPVTASAQALPETFHQGGKPPSFLPPVFSEDPALIACSATRGKQSSSSGNERDFCANGAMNWHGSGPCDVIDNSSADSRSDGSTLLSSYTRTNSRSSSLCAPSPAWSATSVREEGAGYSGCVSALSSSPLPTRSLASKWESAASHFCLNNSSVVGSPGRSGLLVSSMGKPIGSGSAVHSSNCNNKDANNVLLKNNSSISACRLMNGNSRSSRRPGDSNGSSSRASGGSGRSYTTGTPGRIYSLLVRGVRCWRAEWHERGTAGGQRRTRQYAAPKHGEEKARAMCLRALCQAGCVPVHLLREAAELFGYDPAAAAASRAGNAAATSTETSANTTRAESSGAAALAFAASGALPRGDSHPAVVAAMASRHSSAPAGSFGGSLNLPAPAASSVQDASAALTRIAYGVPEGRAGREVAAATSALNFVSTAGSSPRPDSTGTTVHYSQREDFAGKGYSCSESRQAYYSEGTRGTSELYSSSERRNSSSRNCTTSAHRSSRSADHNTCNGPSGTNNEEGSTWQRSSDPRNSGCGLSSGCEGDGLSSNGSASCKNADGDANNVLLCNSTVGAPVDVQQFEGVQKHLQAQTRQQSRKEQLQAPEHQQQQYLRQQHPKGMAEQGGAGTARGQLSTCHSHTLDGDSCTIRPAAWVQLPCGPRVAPTAGAAAAPAGLGTAVRIAGTANPATGPASGDTVASLCASGDLFFCEDSRVLREPAAAPPSDCSDSTTAAATAGIQTVLPAGELRAKADVTATAGGSRGAAAGGAPARCTKLIDSSQGQLNRVPAAGLATAAAPAVLNLAETAAARSDFTDVDTASLATGARLRGEDAAAGSTRNVEQFARESTSASFSQAQLQHAQRQQQQLVWPAESPATAAAAQCVSTTTTSGVGLQWRPFGDASESFSVPLAAPKTEGREETSTTAEAAPGLGKLQIYEEACVAQCKRQRTLSNDANSADTLGMPQQAQQPRYIPATDGTDSVQEQHQRQQLLFSDRQKWPEGHRKPFARQQLLQQTLDLPPGYASLDVSQTPYQETAALSTATPTTATATPAASTPVAAETGSFSSPVESGTGAPAATLLQKILGRGLSFGSSPSLCAYSGYSATVEAAAATAVKTGTTAAFGGRTLPTAEAASAGREPETITATPATAAAADAGSPAAEAPCRAGEGEICGQKRSQLSPDSAAGAGRSSWLIGAQHHQEYVSQQQQPQHQVLPMDVQHPTQKLQHQQQLRLPLYAGDQNSSAHAHHMQVNPPPRLSKGETGEEVQGGMAAQASRAVTAASTSAVTPREARGRPTADVTGPGVTAQGTFALALGTGNSTRATGGPAGGRGKVDEMVNACNTQSPFLLREADAAADNILYRQQDLAAAAGFHKNERFSVFGDISADREANGALSLDSTEELHASQQHQRVQQRPHQLPNNLLQQQHYSQQQGQYSQQQHQHPQVGRRQQHEKQQHTSQLQFFVPSHEMGDAGETEELLRVT